MKKIMPKAPKGKGNLVTVPPFKKQVKVVKTFIKGGKKYK